MSMKQPVWRNQKQMLITAVPSTIACWLFDPGSLTARVVAACQGRFRVEVLSQRWQRPGVNEARRLGMSLHEQALIREVYLHCNDTPWVFARTVIPRRTLTGRLKFLAHLGSKPLGAVLFADPHMHRDPVEVTSLSQTSRLYDKACARLTPLPATIFGRRSVFYLDNKPLLVNEIFLPDIAQCKFSKP